MKQRLALVGVLVMVVATMGILAGSATAARPAPSSNLTVPITGNATNTLREVVNSAGQCTLQSFTISGGQLAAAGLLTGTLTNTVTGAVQTVSLQVVLPAAATGSCQILDLTLGPLDLNLLGLMVHLDQ